MNVKQLMKKLEKMPKNAIIAVRWINPVAPVEEVGLKYLDLDRRCKDIEIIDRSGKVPVVILAPWSIDALGEL